MVGAPAPPTGLPAPRKIELARGGTTMLWDSGPVPGEAEPLVLLHGWNVDAPANFGFAFNELSKDRRVVMFDHHGHGGGLRTDEPFSLEGAAGDVISVLDTLEIDRAVFVGYSLGGAIAQLVARDHPERVEAVVLMATAAVFSEQRRERAQFGLFAVGAKALRRLNESMRQFAFQGISKAACLKYPDWILAVVRTSDPIALLEAGASLGGFDSRSWARTIEAPVAVIITSKDPVIAPSRQFELAKLAQADHVDTVDAEHSIAIEDDPRFAAAISKAVQAVASVVDPVTP